MPKFLQTFINWLRIVIYALIFIALFILAIKNRQSIDLKFFFGYEWNISLAIIIFASIFIGLILGVIFSWFNSYRKVKKREQEITEKLEKHFTKKIQELEKSTVLTSDNKTTTEVVTSN